MAYDGLRVNEPAAAPLVKELGGKYVGGKFIEGVEVVGKDGDNPTTPANPFPVEVQGSVPVTGPLTDAELRAAPVPVSGPLTDAELRAADVDVAVTNFPAVQPVSGPLTDAELRASPVAVSGPLTDAELRAADVDVAVTNFPAVQPVSGPLTDAELRASPVAVSGPLTDAELRAADVDVAVTNFPAVQPVSGTVTADQGAPGASPWPVSQPNAVLMTGSAVATGILAGLDFIDALGLESIDLQLLGVFVGVIVVEGTNSPLAAPGDGPGVNGWASITLISASSGARATSVQNTGRSLGFNLPRKIRVRCTAYTSGTITANLLLKAHSEENPARYITDQDGLSRWALTTFGTGIVATKTYLCGDDFDTPAGLDTNIWTSLHGGSGSKVFAGGVIELKTGVTPDSFEGVQSINVANFIGGADNSISITARVGDLGTVNNVKRWGVFDDSDGIFIEQNSTGITFITRKGGVDTASPFGIIGTLPITNSLANSFWEIVFNPAFVIIRQNGNLVQLFIGSATLASLFNRFDLPVRAENRNVSGGASDTSLFIQTLVANRLGRETTIRANETFQDEHVLSATSAVIQGRLPSGMFSQVPASGTIAEQETTTPLGAGATFTGSAWNECSGYSEVSITIKADQQSAVGGIEMQFSNDGITIIRTVNFTFGAAEVATGNAFYSLPIEGNYFRLKFTNGGIAQTIFIVHALLSSQSLGTPKSPVEGVISQSSTASMVRNVANAKNRNTGAYANIQSGSAGGLDVGIVQFEVPAPIKALTTAQVKQVTVGAAAVQLDSSPLANRKSIEIRALNSNGSQRVYVGFSAAVGTSTGRELVANEPITLELDENIQVWGIATSAGQGVCVTEVGGTP